MRIDRWNGNTLRRYHIGGAIVGVIRMPGRPRRCFIIPASIPFGVTCDVPDSWVLDHLRRARSRPT